VILKDEKSIYIGGLVSEHTPKASFVTSVSFHFVLFKNGFNVLQLAKSSLMSLTCKVVLS
jgi:hypothetical protein